MINLGMLKKVGHVMNAGYRSRIKSQINQFADTAKLKKLPPIYQYYVRKFLQPRLLQVFGCNNALSFYVDHFASTLEKEGSGRLMSIGSGDCNVEINIAKAMIKKGVTDFVFECHELSEIRLNRGEELARREGLCDKFSFHSTDFNSFELQNKYSAIMAHHTLHHIVELERLFEQIQKSLTPNGRFVTIDMIGRNGHMRWSEALELVELIWKFMPERYKYNHQFEEFHKDYINWDCSKRGFEGIRAQDILGLIGKYFNCDKFYAYGNLPDIFIERGYGHNLDEENQSDTAFIDFLEKINDRMIDSGCLKPTMMFGIFANQSVETKPIVYKNRTPDFCVRRVTESD